MRSSEARPSPAVLTVLLVMTPAALLVALPAGGAVIEVGPGASITAALSRAQTGDTILLSGAEYQERLVVDVPVRLVGRSRPRPLIRGGYTGHVIHVTASGTSLEGLAVAESGPHLTKDLAGILVEADDVTIRACSVSEALHGIYVKGGQRARIEGSQITGRLDLIEADRGNGIHLWNTSGNMIRGNEISHVRDGIYFSFAHQTEVTENHIHHVRYGLHYMYSNNNSFTDNNFQLNVAGAALMYSEDITFTRNVFARCRGFRAYGILLQSMSRVTARSNLVLDNSRGLFMNNSDNNLFELNHIVDNDLAIQLNGGCDGNQLVRNSFVNNLSELLLDVSDRETRWADDESGNHWSSYQGYDLDRDGIGDLAFSIQNVFQVMESKAPEARFYLLSPAAEVLEAAEQALPILSLGDASDPRPLMNAMEGHEVPWDREPGWQTSASPAWAATFLLIALVPAMALFQAGRRGSDQAQRTTRADRAEKHEKTQP